MPPKPPAPHCVQFTVHQTLGLDLAVANVHHMSFAALSVAATPADLLTAATDFLTIWVSRFPFELGGDQFTTGCTAKDIGVVNGGDATHVITPVQGGIGGGDFPANVALVVSWSEFLSYKGGHPRTYLAGIPRTAGLNPQQVAPAYATNVQTTANAFLADLAGHTWPTAWGAGELVVVHYRLNGAALTPPEPRPITGALVNQRFDSQRRRLGA